VHSTQHIIGKACLQLCQQSLSAFDVVKSRECRQEGGSCQVAARASATSGGQQSVETHWACTLLGSKGEMWNS